MRLRIRRGGSSCGIVLLNLLWVSYEMREALGSRECATETSRPWVASYCRSMREPSRSEPATRGQLRASGYVSRRIKVELRDNLLQRLRSGTAAFPGIVGFDLTGAARSWRARFLLVTIWCLLGERGQGKTRLMRTIAGSARRVEPQGRWL